MNTRKPALAALALATALAGAAGLGTLPARDAAAQATTAPQQTQAPERHHSASRHIEGRIAYMKAELKISDAQAPQFERVAQAMRDNAKSDDQKKAADELLARHGHEHGHERGRL